MHPLPVDTRTRFHCLCRLGFGPQLTLPVCSIVCVDGASVVLWLPACLPMPAYVLWLHACLSAYCLRFVCLPAYVTARLSYGLSPCRSVGRSLASSVGRSASVSRSVCTPACVPACRAVGLSACLSACHSRRVTQTPSRAAPTEAAHGPPQGPSTTGEPAACPCR